jgi:phosphatidylinositol 3-kinase
VTNEPVGGTTVRFFNEKGVMRSGLQKLVVWESVEADGGLDSKTPSQIEGLDECFRLQKVRERYDRGEIRKVDWLDQLMFERMQSMENAVTPLPDSFRATIGGPDSGIFMLVELPFFGDDVLYEENAYNITAGHTLKQMPSYSNSYESIDSQDAGGGVWWSEHLLVVDDPGLDAPNPVEAKHRKLTRDMLRGLIDPNLKPNIEERAKLEQVIEAPGYDLTNEQKDLLWRFRYSLTDNKQALTKFIMCVDWNEESEAKQATELLQKWVAIDFAAALKLLGKEPEFKNVVVRHYAVTTLQRASDDELMDYLLQLVQALRYEPERASATSIGLEGESESADAVSPLAMFLINRAVNCPELANFLYWYLKVEKSSGTDEQALMMFQQVFKVFELQLERGANSIYRMIKQQDIFMSQVAASQVKARHSKGRKDQKQENLRKYLRTDVDKVPANIVLPLDPSCKITCIRPTSAKVFKSAMYPAMIEFEVEPCDLGGGGGGAGSSGGSVAAAKKEEGGQKNFASSVTSYFGGTDTTKVRIRFMPTRYAHHAH